MDKERLTSLVAEIASAHVANNTVAISDVPALISNIAAGLRSLDEPPEVVVEKPVPPAGVTIRNSIRPDFIVCLEDGKRLKMLKRHLSTRYGMTPDEYRAKWGLRPDYPMTAANYTERRRALAVANGLGTRRGRDRVAPVRAAH